MSLPDATPTHSSRALLRRMGRRVGLAVAVLVLVVVLVPGGMGFMTLWGVTHPPCAPGRAPQDYGLTAQDVQIPLRVGVTVQGYFIPGTNGATIIVPPAYSQDRGGWLHEAAILADHGYSVLTYDGRPCVGLGPHSLGYWEAEDILDTLAYLRARGDVDMSRIGLHGFSQAGASNLFAAARSPQIQAVVAEGGYVDYAAQTFSLGTTDDWFTQLFGLGAQVGYRAVTGLDIGVLKPLDVLDAIAPRPVLLVYGTNENTLHGARQAAAQHDHVRLWEVPDATHGSYLASAGEAAFSEVVVGFFDAALGVSR